MMEWQTTTALTWDEYEWPEWIPEEIREQIRQFWSASARRSPKAWLESMRTQKSPPLGFVGSFPSLRSDGLRFTGRWVFCWNNIGRVVEDSGAWAYVSKEFDWTPPVEGELDQRQWFAQAIERFGADHMQWRVVCPACGHTASLQQYKDAGAPSSAFGFNCIGRYLPDKTKMEPPGPCDYTGGGLIQLNPVAVRMKTGLLANVFNWAEREVVDVS